MLFVNAGTDRFGIGESIPDTLIHATSSTARLTLESTADDESSIAHITPQGGTYVGQAGANGEIISTSSAGDYVVSNRTGGDIHLSADTSFSQAHLTIDELGRVTTPYQPLCAFKSSISTTSDQRYGVTNTILNQGSHLDTGSNSGRFTCPVAGNYKCTFIGYTNYTSGYGYIHLRKNGVTQGHATHWNHAGGTAHTTVGNSFIVNCAAGNYLEFWLLNANSRVQDANITFELIG
jgi:hypothetical protein